MTSGRPLAQRLKTIAISSAFDRSFLSMTDFGTLLTEISREQLTDPDVAAATPDNKVAAGWLGEPGATDEEISSAEHRLGMRLPPSYRSFLAVSNGFRDISPFIYRL
jgi:hypothetical protein